MKYANTIIDNFCEAACLNKKYDPWVRRRKFGLEYANITITNKGRHFGNGVYCWWAEFVGVECLAQIEFEVCVYTGKKTLGEATPVRLMNTSMVHGRSISPNSYSII